MIKRLFNLFKGNERELVPKGFGVAELPFNIYSKEKKVKSSDFKKLVNEIFLPRIHELGFKGKDYVYYRENLTYTEVILFWTFEVGGAIGVDLLVKFKGINYSEDTKEIKAKDIRAYNAEFDRRLSPNGEKNMQGTNVWFWVFEDEIEDNKKLVEDIWRVFEIRGVEYFDNFKNHQNYIGQVTTKNYKDFQDFHLNFMVGRFEVGIIYFLFKYWLKANEIKRANAFAILGLEKIKGKQDSPYFLIFKNHLEEHQ